MSDYVFVCLVCAVPLVEPWQVCGARCYERLVADQVSA